MEWWKIVLAALTGSFLGHLFSRSGPDYSARLRLLEQKVDLLLRHFELAPPKSADVSEAVWAELQAGQKIQAIKVYRQEHPEASLKEAKDIIDELSMRVPSPLAELLGLPFGTRKNEQGKPE